MRFRGTLLFATACAACAPAARDAAPPRAPDSLHDLPSSGPGDPTLLGARFVPLVAHVDELCGSSACGVEPGGGVRSMAEDVRVVTHPNGAVVSADDRFGTRPSRVVVLPDRLGGGFLFLVRETVWRADHWLSPARPIYASNAHLDAVVAGLDRVYVHAKTWRAIDAKSGAELSLGPWPATPNVRAFAALDGWRAIAIADLRGTIATSDAGATWQPLRLPYDAWDVTVSGDSFEVASTVGPFEVRPDGQVLPAAERPPPPTVSAIESLTSRGGLEPLREAIEDGWPVGDGTALVARDGSLARVRLEDGAVVERAARAYPASRGRCHAVALGARDRVGFVCGEPHGATVVYTFDPARGRMVEDRRFDAPRAVLASGNGALAVRGACMGESSVARAAYCVRVLDGGWREIHLEGGSGDERVVVLADGRVAILSPPHGELTDARLTIVDGGRAASVPVVFGAIDANPQRILEVGMWLDGFEERRPGVLGGWVEVRGMIVGVEIGLDGRARTGVDRESGSPMVSGRYALGWKESRGYESIDGGMTWNELDVPLPMTRDREVASRACGPLGCTAAGWLRVGWGKPRVAPPEAIQPKPTPGHRGASLSLACDFAEPPSAVHAERAGHPGHPHVLASGERVVLYEVRDALTQTSHFASIEAWGPKSSEWEHVAKWVVRWSSPFTGPRETHVSTPAPAPWPILEAVRPTAIPTPYPVWSVATSDDGVHALLNARLPSGARALFVLEPDRAPVEVRRADGEPLAWAEDTLASLYANGRWYVATPPRAGGRLETLVWQVDGSTVRELARVPRVRDDKNRVVPPQLAWRTDGRSLGIVVAGAPLESREQTRWIVGIDPETGALGDVQPLGLADLGDRARPLPLCAGDEAGWRLDARVDEQWNVQFASATTAERLASLYALGARLVLGETSGCVGGLATSTRFVPLDDHALRVARPPGTSMSVAMASDRERRLLTCVAH